MSRHFDLVKELDGKRWKSSFQTNRDTVDVIPVKSLESKVGPQTSDALSKLVHRIFLGTDSARCVLFSGVTAGVGCTWIAAHSAEALCEETDDPVCLAEIGTNSNWIGDYFQLRMLNTTDLLVEDGPSYKSFRKPGSNLCVVSPIEAESTDLNSTFSAQRLDNLLLHLRAEFQYVLVDISPPSSSPRVRPGTPVDGAILVLKAGQTPRPAVKRAVDELGTSGIKVLGTVLNQREYPIPAALFKHL